jgi:signal transduction histidine kinase
MASIHGKITFAYTVMAVVIAGLSAFAFLDLLFLEKQVYEGVSVSDLNDLTLEMRREEKNLFLYGHVEALQAARRYAKKARGILTREHDHLVTLSDRETLRSLEAEFDAYAGLMESYRADTGQQTSVEERIRETGHRIASETDQLARRERQALAASIAASQWSLALSILVVALLVLGIGRRLARAVVRPLRRLESDLTPIAQGELDHLDAHSNDRELVAFTGAFNRMLAELESRRRRLLQAEKLAALGVLAAGVAHELNNPLSNISSSIQLLIEELDGSEREQLRLWASQIDDETRRAHRIVSALLDFGRQRDFRLRPVSLRELLDKTLLLLRNHLGKASAEVITAIPEDVRVQADPQRLQQALINLLRNALDASAPGMTIRVQASPCQAQSDALPDDLQVIGDPDCGTGPRVQLEIADDGPGMDREMLTRIFEPFFTTREPGRGMGLGLYIVQEIIQEHGGCIAVASRTGQGTRFYIRLHCAADET